MSDDRTTPPDRDDSHLAEDPTLDAGATLSSGQGAAVPGESPGTRIGRYRLVRPLGEGGFGTVFLAEQLEPVSREVALKIIKLGMDTKQVIARFEAERQALAMMDHPGIAKVYDAGTTDAGRPYFVMELVKGVPITEYCDRRRMRTRRRLELFGQVCAAVQHAHQKGIIHRDIKPSNVLVSDIDGQAVPKVIDFGIAKATSRRLTEKTVFTQQAQLIGTPAYMSPEQAEVTEIDIDTRSDIYSLGVLLYELLAGATPFDSAQLLSAGFGEIQRIIKEVDPPLPSSRVSGLGDRLQQTSDHRQLRGVQLVKRLKGELDWIVMKCLEKDRTRRYETANGLARDLERYLSDEPVSASPPSRSYRLKKLVVRNRAVFAAGFVMVALLGAGVIGTSVGMVRAKKAEREAVVAAAKSDQVAGFLTDMLSGVGPSAARGRDTEMLEEILQETHAKIGEELADQPEVEGEIRSYLGQTYYDLGRLEKAKEQFGIARDRLVEAHGENHGDTARQFSNLGLVHEALSEFEESEANHLKALELRRVIFDDVHEDMAMNLINLANLYVNVSRYEEAEPLMLEGLEQLRGLYPDGDEVLAICLNSLGNLMQHLRRYDEAGPYYEEALAMHIATLGEDHPYVITDMSNLGWLALNTGDLEGAAERFGETVELSRRVYAEFHPNLIHAINAQAKAEQRLGRYETAEPLFREAVAMAGEVYGPDHASTADEVIALAGCLTDMGRIEEADEMTRRAIGIHDEVFGPGHETTLRSRYNYAYSVFNRGDYDVAIPLLQESVDAYTEAVGRDHKNTALAINNLGRALREAGRLGEAEDAFAETREIRVRILGPDHLLVAVADHDIGKNRFFQGRPDEADDLLNAALAVYDAQLDSTHSVYASILRMMARVDLDLDRPRQALERLERGRPVAVATKGGDHEEILVFDLLGGVARARLGEVKQAESVAETIEPRLAGLEPEMRAECLLELGRIHAQTGRYEEAERALTEARDIYEGSFGAVHHLTGRAVRQLAELDRMRRADG